MQTKRTFWLTVNLFLVISCFLTSVFAEVSDDFKKNLKKVDVVDISIMIPGDLIEPPNGATEISRFFWDSAKDKSINVFVEERPLPEDLIGVVSSWYEFDEKAYFPGADPTYLEWNKLSTSKWGADPQIVKIDLSDYKGFIGKGSYSQADGTIRHIRSFELFDKKDIDKRVTVVFTSRSGSDYFLTDEEAAYIVSTITTSY
jgi:hypothetical protein